MRNSLFLKFSKTVSKATSPLTEIIEAIGAGGHGTSDIYKAYVSFPALVTLYSCTIWYP